MADADEAGSRVHGLARSGNELLAAMPAADLHFIAARGRRRVLRRDQIISRAGEAAETVFFIEHGIASVVKVEADGRRTEICLIGPEGFTGAAVILGDGRSPYEICSQSDPLQMVGLSSADLGSLVAGSDAARTLLHAAIFLQFNQTAENLISAVRQQVEPRLARWLLMYRERLRSDRIEITHAYMAIMIGSQRTKVTHALHELEACGAIAASRGLILVTDAETLRIVAARGLATGVVAS